MNHPTGEYLIKDLSNFKILRTLAGINYDKNHKIQCAIIMLSRIVFIYTLPGQIIKYIKLNVFDINSTIEYLVPFICCIQFLLRNIFYSWKYDEYTKLRAYVKQHFWPISCVPNKNNRQSLEKKLKLFQYGCIFYPIIFLTTALLYCFHPMVDPIPGEKRLPIRLWLPYDINPPVIHFITFYVLIIMSGIGAFCIFATDLLFIYFITHLVVQINILAELIENICYNRFDEEDRKHSLIECKSYQILIYDKLKICTKHHEKLLKFQEKLQQLFNGLLLFQLFMSTTMVCVSGYAFTKADDTTKKFNHLAVLMSVSFSLMVYCIPGSVLEQQNDELFISINQTKWYRGNVKFRKSFLFFLYQTLYQPFALSVIGVFPVNNLFVVQAYKLGFSCITMLKTIEEKQ